MATGREREVPVHKRPHQEYRAPSPGPRSRPASHYSAVGMAARASIRSRAELRNRVRNQLRNDAGALIIIRERPGTGYVGSRHGGSSGRAY